MTQHTAAHTAGGVEDAVSARLAAAALWALQGPGPLDVRTGVVYAPASPMLVTGTASTSPWSVTVNAGHVVGSKGASNGPYYAANDALYTVNLTVPPASNSRIDVIYAMQMDPAAIVNADGSVAAVLTVAPGTPSATPAVPAIPSGAVALAQVLIASTAVAGTSGANVTITDVRQFTTTRGNPIPVRTKAERDLITAVDGGEIYRLDTHMVETFDGTAYAQPYPVTTWANGGDLQIAAGGGTVVPVQSFPAWSHASRVFVQATGNAGFATAASSNAVTIASSLTVTQGTSHQVPAAISTWEPVAATGYVDIPANTTATIWCVSVQSIANVWFSVAATFTRVNH